MEIQPPKFHPGDAVQQSVILEVTGREQRSPGTKDHSWFYLIQCECGNTFKYNQENILRKIKEDRILHCSKCRPVKKPKKVSRNMLFINWGYNPKESVKNVKV